MSLKQLFSCFAIVSLMFVVGCEDKAGDVDNTKPNNPTDTPEEPEAATFELEKETLEFTAEGGDATIAYTITNPVKGGVVLTDCTEGWVKNLSTATYGSIKFTVAPNYTNKSREAVINVTYTGVEDKFSIKVMQEASTDPVFAIKVVHNAPRMLMLDITPADKETAYVCDRYTQEHIDVNNLGTDAALYNYHLKAMAYTAERNGQSLFNYLKNNSYTGKAMDVEFNELYPDKDYVVFCYHIDLNTAEIIGDIYREVIRTGKPELLDVELGMTLEVANNAINQVITSSDADVYFNTGYMQMDYFKSYYHGASMEEVFPAKWNETVIIQMSFGKSVSQILDEFCRKGSQTIANTGLANYTEYVFYLFAVDTVTGFVASEPIFATATTTSAEDSGVTIEITVENILANSASIYWRASDHAATFERSFLTKSEYDALGSNDEARFAALRANYTSFYVATGETDMSPTSLEANTSYVAFAFGVDGETPNTRIFTTEFRTLGDKPGKSNITIAWDKHYNLAEVAAADATHWGDYATYANSALVPATISGVTSGDDVYIMLSTLPIDYYNYDTEWIRDIVNDKYKVNYYANYNLIMEYEREYTIIAIARDADGNLGTLYKGEACLYKSDSAAASSYVYKENK